MTTVQKSSRSIGRKSRSTKTSGIAGDTTWRPLTLSAAGSPANLFRLRADGKLKPILAGSGRSLPVSSVSYNPATYSWRTSQDSTPQEVPKSSLILPRAGMMRNGTLYLRRSLVPRTSVIASSLWRTPSAQLAGENETYLEMLRDKDGGPPRRGRRVYNPKDGKHIILTLNRQVQLWRTPQARDGDPRGQQSPEKRRADGHSVSLAEQVMWPTPTQRDWRSGKASLATMERNARPLSEMVGGTLNPVWVEWLMGFPLGWTDLEH